MKNTIQNLAVSALALSCFMINSLPISANPNFSISTIVQSSNITSNSRSSTTVNHNLVATVANHLQVDIGKKQSQTINLVLVQPFLSFPAGSYLRATIRSTEDGNAILIAETLYHNNQVLKINAESEILYGQTVRVTNRSQEALKRTATASQIGGLIGTALGEDVETIIQITTIAGSVGFTTGLLSPQKVQLLNLTPGTPIFFNVDKNK